MCLRNTIARLPNAVDSITLIRMGATALVDLTAQVVVTAPVDLTAQVVLTAPVVQGHLCLHQRPLVLSVMRDAI